MSQSTKVRAGRPAPERENPGVELADAEVLAFRTAFNGSSPLDQLVHEGARQMLQAAVDAEVEAFVAQHALRRDDQGRRLVVRTGHLPQREILTGAGPLPVRQPRVH
ncbi:MAG: hypothetical protein K8T91_18750 [Planctomycetes bacterium]|nr:hypothetical protein [Planctomycetota bacterium]